MIAAALAVGLALGGGAGWLLARARAAETAATLRETNARLNAELDHQRAVIPEKVALLAEVQDQLRDSFQALAASALQTNTQQFLDLADQKIGNVQKEAAAGLGERQQALDALVNPIKETLAQVGAKLADVERQRVHDSAGIRSTLEGVQQAHHKLEREAQSLVRALRTPNVRGRWGEMQLRRVVEMADMLASCDFEEQPTLLADAGHRLRPDLIVRLPGGRTVVVDAKVPLEAYLNAQDAADEGARARFMADHARQVRDHIQKLSAKAYWEQFQPSPEFVVMFLPGESFFQAALHEDPALIEFGVRNHVFPASPITLIALLRAVAHGWRQEQIAKNATELSELGKELYNRITTMTEHLDDLRKKLDGSVQAYNRLVGSYEGRVLVQARKLKDFGAATGDELPAQEQIDTTPRVLQGTSLFGPGDEAVVEAEAITGDRR